MARRERVNVGDMSFVVKGVSVLKPRVTGSCTLITATPIIVRIRFHKLGEMRLAR